MTPHLPSENNPFEALAASASRGLSGCRLAALLALSLGAWSSAGSAAPAWPELRRDLAARFPKVTAIGTAELARWLADPQREPPLLVDVRARGEYEVSHLEGAVSAATREQQAEAVRRAKPGQAVVFYCSVGWRSAQAADRRGKSPGPILLNLDGSIFQWANEGRPLVNAAGAPTLGVHPYNRIWGTLLNRNRWSHEP